MEYRTIYSLLGFHSRKKQKNKKIKNKKHKKHKNTKRNFLFFSFLFLPAKIKNRYPRCDPRSQIPDPRPQTTCILVFSAVYCQPSASYFNGILDSILFQIMVQINRKADFFRGSLHQICRQHRRRGKRYS